MSTDVFAFLRAVVVAVAAFRDVRMKKPVDVYDGAYFRKCLDRQADIGRKVKHSHNTHIHTHSAWFPLPCPALLSLTHDVEQAYYLLATGNLVSSTGLDQMQVTGYTVVADKINFLRYATHFRR